MGNNPILFADFLGDTVNVTTNDGDFLFNLDDGSKEVTTSTAKDLYDQGTQWFEPNADNYMPLISMAENLSESSSLKHFSWEAIAKFAEAKFANIQFVQGGEADWKRHKNGADKYFLVTVDGKPYWADAVGNMIFGVWAFKETGSVNKTTLLGFIYDDGSAFNAFDNGKNISEKINNHYDIYSVVRGALFANQNYISIGAGMYQPSGKNVSPTMLGNHIKKKLF